LVFTNSMAIDRIPGIYLRHPLIFSRVKMQLVIGISAQRFSHDES
jgi:hypothetical protein